MAASKKTENNHNPITQRPLPALEQLAIGASAYGKCKSHQIDTTEDLLEAFRTGAIKSVLKSDMLRSVRQVLTVAGIPVPDVQAPEAESVTIQTKTEALEQLRREYETKLKELRTEVQTLCMVVANLSDCKEKVTLRQNIRNIISDIEQRIGKE